MNFFAKNLKWLRQQRNISQAKMAEDIGSQRSTLANYENEFSTPDLDRLIRIANYLDVTIDSILTKDLSIITSMDDDSKPEIVIPKGVDLNKLEKNPNTEIEKLQKSNQILEEILDTKNKLQRYHENEIERLKNEVEKKDKEIQQLRSKLQKGINANAQ